MVLFRKINLLFFLLLSTTLANAQNSNEVYKGKGDNDPLYYRYNPEVEGLEVCAVPSGENPYYGKIEIPVEATISVAGEPMTFGVVGICKDAFKNCSLLSSVDIPSSVTSIGSNAFNGCSNYTVNFSSIDHVLSIEYGNPDSNPMYTAEITTIGGKILSEIQIDTDIRPYAFVKATWLKEVVLGDNVKNINNKAFYGCNNLKTLVIPSVTSIGTNAFEGCKSLTEIEFPPTLTSIGKEAFRNCTGLQYIVIPENINDIYGSAFYGCNNLIDLIISNRTSTLLIAENAFSSLKHIYSKALTMPQAHINAFGGKTDIQLFYKSEVNYDVDGTPWKALKKSPITSNTISYYLDGELYNELKDVEAGTLIDPLGRPDSDRDFSRWKNEPRIMPNEAVDVNGSLKYKLTYVAGDTDDQLNKEDIFYFYGDLISDPKELTKDGLTYVITNSIQTMPANDDYKVRVVYSLKDDKVPTAKTGLKFNNTEQDLVNYKSLKEGSGKITYSLDNETFSDKITAKDVGSYPVYYRVEDITKKYCTASGSLPDPVTISPAASSLTKTPTAKTITYDGTDQVLINEGASSTGTLQYKLKEENEFSKTIPTGKDAGDYIVNYKVKGDANHSDSEIGSVKVTIAKRKPSSINWKENYNFVYDGNAKEPKITVKWKDEEGKEYDVPEDQYSLSYEKNINVGTATVTITDKEGGNYNVGGIKSFTINKASIELGDDLFETPPSVKNGLVFKGAADAFAGIAQDLITGGTLKNPEIGTLEYSTNGKDFSEDIPTGIDAKKYSVYYRVKGSDNYNNSAISSAMEVKIAPKELTPEEIVITLSPSSYTYDGSEKKPGVTVKFGNTEFTKDKDYTVSYSNNKFVGTEEKQPTVTIKDKDGGNYIVSGSKTFEITRAASSMTKTPTAKTVTYDGTDQVLINEGASSTGTLQYKLKEEDEFSETIPTGKNAGDYTVYFRVKGDTNHSDSEISQVKVTIDPKEITFFNLSQASYTYDGSEKKPDVTVKDGNTTVSIEEYTVSYTNNTNVGTATVTITDKEGGNYNVSGIKTFTITKADIELKDDLFATPPAGIKDLIFNGTADAFAGTAQALIDAKTGTLKEPVPGTLEYSTDGKNFAVDIPTGTDAITYKVYYRVKGDANHNNSAISKAVEVSIAPKELKSNEIEITLSQNTFTYTGSEIKPDVTVKFGNTEFTKDKDYTVSYSNNKAVGTEENPPTVTIKDKDGGNYIVSGSKTFEIKRAASSLTKKPTAKTVTYDGTDQALINAGETSTGTLQYRLSEDEEFSEMIPTRKNAGDYTVYYRVKGDTNHSDSEIGSVKATIAKRKPSSINWKENYNFVYDGKAKEPKVNVKWKDKDGNEYDVPENQYNLSWNDNVNAGKEATVTIKNIEGGNFDINATKTFTIAKADIELKDDLFATPPAGIKDLIFNGTADAFAGTAQALIDAKTGTLKEPVPGTLEYSTDGKNFAVDIPTGKDVKTYMVYYRVKGDANHNNSATSKAVEVSIAPKELKSNEIEITLSQNTFTYTGSEIKPDVTVKFGNTEFTKDKDYTVSYSSNKAVGTEENPPTVTIKDKDGGNYIVSGIKTFEIKRAASSLTKEPKAKTITYNGTNQALIDAGASSTGKVQYSLSKDEKSFSETIPTGKNAGDYTVYYRVKGDGNHGDSEISSIPVQIAQREITSFNLSQTSYTYDGSEKKPSVTVTYNSTTVSPDEYTVSYANNIKAGTATVTLTDKTGGNFKVSGTKTFTINKADGSLKQKPAGIENLTYNGVAQNLITAGSSETGTIEYSLDNVNYGTTIPTGTNAKNYIVYYRVKGDANHKDVGTSQFNVTIAKAALTISGGYYEIFEGDAIPKFTVSYDGFKNNETEAVLTTKPTVSCKATTDSKSGEYTINVSGAKADNYNITHKNGKLVIMAMKFESGGDTSKEEDDKATYQITSKESKGGATPTVAITDDKEVSGKFEIPESVIYYDKTFTVTEIAEGAFENNKNLTDVIIPSSISGIGDKAFKGCTNLESITVYITTPINLSVAEARGTTRSDGSSIFEGVNKETCVLYVPDGSVDLYKAAPVWKDFKHIVPLSTTGIKVVTMTDGDECFDIYNLQGQKVKSKATNLKGLPRGIYIINGKKIAVK